VCPAGGVHEATGSGNYTLFIHQPGQDIGQHDWHDCVKCRGLYFAGNGSNGLCPAGRDHKTTGTGSYLLSGVG
jgi:hypothetical protein